MSTCLELECLRIYKNVKGERVVASRLCGGCLGLMFIPTVWMMGVLILEFAGLSVPISVLPELLEVSSEFTVVFVGWDL